MAARMESVMTVVMMREVYMTVRRASLGGASKSHNGAGIRQAHAERI
jgi:hypothetical protein